MILASLAFNTLTYSLPHQLPLERLDCQDHSDINSVDNDDNDEDMLKMRRIIMIMMAKMNLFDGSAG